MKIELLRGDITLVPTIAIVNAANSSLLGGGGVDGAIHRAGGKQILEECMQIRQQRGGCKVGEAVITSAGNMPAQYVIHTVGPHWNGGKSRERYKLAKCYQNSLALADAYKISSIAFPNISTGIYRFPKQLAADIAIESVRSAVLKHVERIVFVCFDATNFALYKEKLQL